MVLVKKNRIVKKKEIDSVFKEGRTVKGSFLFIKFLENQAGYPRVVFIVSSKYSPLAVTRNKIKRILSEEIKEVPGFLSLSFDMAVVVSKKINKDNLDTLRQELTSLVLKIQ